MEVPSPPPSSWGLSSHGDTLYPPCSPKASGWGQGAPGEWEVVGQVEGTSLLKLTWFSGKVRTLPPPPGSGDSHRRHPPHTHTGAQSCGWRTGGHLAPKLHLSPGRRLGPTAPGRTRPERAGGGSDGKAAAPPGGRRPPQSSAHSAGKTALLWELPSLPSSSHFLPG